MYFGYIGYGLNNPFARSAAYYYALDTLTSGFHNPNNNFFARYNGPTVGDLLAANQPVRQGLYGFDGTVLPEPGMNVFAQDPFESEFTGATFPSLFSFPNQGTGVLSPDIMLMGYQSPIANPIPYMTGGLFYPDSEVALPPIPMIPNLSSRQNSTQQTQRQQEHTSTQSAHRSSTRSSTSSGFRQQQLHTTQPSRTGRLSRPQSSRQNQPSHNILNTNQRVQHSSTNNPNITTPYTGTAKDINRYLRGKLAGKGQVFLDAQEKYGINAGFLAAICIHESSNGNSNLAKTKNNVGGVRYPGKNEFRYYDSVDECIMHMAKFLKSGYIDRGLTTIAQVGSRYCPTNDPTDVNGLNSNWVTGVSRVYNSDFA